MCPSKRGDRRAAQRMTEAMRKLKLWHFCQHGSADTPLRFSALSVFSALNRDVVGPIEWLREALREFAHGERFLTVCSAEPAESRGEPQRSCHANRLGDAGEQPSFPDASYDFCASALLRASSIELFGQEARSHVHRSVAFSPPPNLFGGAGDSALVQNRHPTEQARRRCVHNRALCAQYLSSADFVLRILVPGLPLG